MSYRFRPTASVMVLAVLFWQTGSPSGDGVQAADRTPIYAAAEAYRQAVCQFERQVLRTPKIRSSVKRLVDDLENSTERLMVAARDPGRFDRLYRRFIASDKHYSQVELTFFGDPLFSPGPVLESSWIAVDQTHWRFTTELQYLLRLRNAKRGDFAPIINHEAVAQPLPAQPLPTQPFPAYPSSATVPAFPSQTPVLRSQTMLPDVRFESEGYASRPAAAFSAAGVERLEGRNPVSRGADDAVPGRRVILTPQQLRAAVLDALGQ